MIVHILGLLRTSAELFPNILRLRCQPKSGSILFVGSCELRSSVPFLSESRHEAAKSLFRPFLVHLHPVLRTDRHLEDLATVANRFVLGIDDGRVQEC